MKIIDRKYCKCPICGEEHELLTIEDDETNIFKGEKIVYPVKLIYCDNTGESYSVNDQINENDISMKDAYRRKIGLLTSGEIKEIRKKYGISQSDLSLMLGWGEKTVTRYEGHQVQDMSHDIILRKLRDDPDWFLDLLKRYIDRNPGSSFIKYNVAAIKILKKTNNEERDYAYKTFESVEYSPDIKRSLEYVRKSCNMTQKELAEKTGISQESISRIEKGTSIPSVKTLMILAKGMDKKLKISFE